jgi:hypothetical protein
MVFPEKLEFETSPCLGDLPARTKDFRHISALQHSPWQAGIL